jgi:dihydroorotase
VLETMQTIGMPLLVHGEVTDPAVDIFDREAVFIDRILLKTLADFPALKIVLEHITTRQSADLLVSGQFPNLAATITPQHLMLNRNALFDGGLRPHAYCLPVIKREEHRRAVRKAAVAGLPNIFLGTDSAPHVVGAKESGCGCAGLFNAPFALEAYAQVFDEEGALDTLAGFASEHGPRFYGLPLNEGTVTLARGDAQVPERIGDIVPFGAGRSFGWRRVG